MTYNEHALYAIDYASGTTLARGHETARELARREYQGSTLRPATHDETARYAIAKVVAAQ